MKQRFLVTFEININGATHDFGGNPMNARNERQLDLDDPVGEFMEVFESLPMVVSRIIITPSAVSKLAQSALLAEHVRQLAEIPDAPNLVLSFGANGTVFGYTVNEIFTDQLPGLPPITVEEVAW